MEANFNLSSLKIVQNPLNEYFIQINEKLEIEKQNIENISIGFYVDLIGKTQKTLKMIGLFGLSKVLISTKDGFESYGNFDGQSKINFINTVSVLFKNVPLYIDGLVNGLQDEPIKFFEKYKEINDLLNVNVSVKDLFYPRLDLKANLNEEIVQSLKVGVFITEGNKINLLKHLEKIKVTLNSKINDLKDKLKSDLNNESTKEVQLLIKSCYESFEHLQKLKISKGVHIFAGLSKLYVCILSPVFNKSFNESVKYKAEIDVVLNSTLTIVEQIVTSIDSLEEGEKTGILKIDSENVKDLVYSSIFHVKENEDLKELQVYKDLELYFDFTGYFTQLSHTKINLHETIFTKNEMEEVDRVFNEFKEDVINLGVKKKSSNENFNDQLNKTINSNKKLHELIKNIDELNLFLNETSNFFTIIKSNKLSFTDIMEKEISLALVLISYAIDLFVRKPMGTNVDFIKQIELEIKRLHLALNNSEDDLKAMDLPKINSDAQKVDEIKAYAKLFNQMHIELIEVEEILDLFIRSDYGDKSNLEKTIKVLSSTKGIFGIINYPILINIVDFIVNNIKKINSDNSGKSEGFDLSIKLLGGVLLFVNAYKNENEYEAEEIYNNLIKHYIKETKSNNDTVNNVEVEVENDKSEHIEVENNQTEYVENKLINTESDLVLVVDADISEVKTDTKENIVEIKAQENVLEIKDGINGLYVETFNDMELAEFFILEVDEVLENMKNSLLVLSKNTNDQEELTNVRRNFHTLKGSGRMVGLNYFGEAAWMVEQTLNQTIQGNLVLGDVLLQALSVMHGKFMVWINDLKTVNSVSVDLVEVKKMFIKINPAITNHFEINIDEPVIEIKTDEVAKSYMVDSLPVLDMIVDKNEVNEMSLAHIDGIDVNNLDVEYIELSNKTDGIEVNNLDVEHIELSNKTDSIDVNNLDVEHIELSNKTDGISEELSINEFEETEEELTISEFETDSVQNVTEHEHVDNHVVVEEYKIQNNTLDDSDMDVIIIDGVEVSKSLYELFIEESNEHIKEMESFVDNENGNLVHFNQDFMRHAHTMCSISKTVNRKKLAVIASVLENISTLLIEQERGLSFGEMGYVRSGVYILNDLKNGIDLDTYTDVLNGLNELFEKVSTTTISQDQTNSQDQLKEFKKLLTDFDDKFKLSFKNAKEEKDALELRVEDILQEQFKLYENKFNSFEDVILENVKEIINNTFVNVLDEIKSTMAENNSNANNSDSSEIVDVVEKSGKIVEANYKRIVLELKDQDARNKELVVGLKGQVESLSILIDKQRGDFNTLKESILNKENIEYTGVREDIRKLAATFKRFASGEYGANGQSSSSGGFFGFFKKKQ